MNKLLSIVLGLQPRFQFEDDKGKGAGGADGKGSADTNHDDPNDDASGKGNGSVAYDTYKKTLGEAKQAKARLKELEAKLAGAENDKLAADGKKDELIAKLRGDLDKVSKTHKETLNGFISTSLAAQVREQAATLGCVDLDAAEKLLDLSDVEVDTKTFRANKDELASSLAALKKAKPYLFSKEAPKINTKMGAGGGKGDGGGKRLKEMTRDEILVNMRKLESKQN